MWAIPSCCTAATLRILAGGGSTEPGESVGDPENLDEPDDEELDEMVSDDESDTISVFTDIPEEISPDSDWAREARDDISEEYDEQPEM